MEASELFQNIVVINLAGRPDRWRHCNRMLHEAGIDKVLRFNAIDQAYATQREVARMQRFNLGSWNKYMLAESYIRGQLGCLRSHMFVAEMVLKEGWEYTLVLEDDAACHPCMVDHVSQHLPEVPDDWLSIRLGWGASWSRVSEPVTKNVWRIRAMLNTTATVYRPEAFRRLLKLYEPMEKAVDTYHMGMDKLGRTYGIVPFAFTQAVSRSSIGSYKKHFDSKNLTLFGDYVRWE